MAYIKFAFIIIFYVMGYLLIAYSFLTMINEIDDDNKKIKTFLNTNHKWMKAFKILCFIPGINLVFGILLAAYLYIGKMRVIFIEIR